MRWPSAMRGGLGFLDDFGRTLAGLIDDLHRLVARLADDFLRLHLGFVEILLRLVAGRQTFGDLLLALFDGRHDVAASRNA